MALAWDFHLAHAHNERGPRPIWWSSDQDPLCVVPSFTRAYVDAIGSPFAPEIFPFWFVDTWHEEIETIAWGAPTLKATGAKYLFGLRGQTQGSREFEFWCQTFHDLLPMRHAKALEISEKLKLEYDPAGRDSFLDAFKKRGEFRLTKCEEYERVFGDKSPPSEMYLQAKAQAEELLKEAA